MSLAIGPAVRMATVLLAVQRFTKQVRAAMPISPPLLLLMLRVNVLMMRSMPPLYRMISSMRPARMVTIMSSDMPIMPSFMAANQPNKS